MEQNHTASTIQITGFEAIRQQLAGYASTAQGKALAAGIVPYLSELELKKHMRETTQARKLLEEQGTPPLPRMERVEEYLDKAVRGEMLLPEQIEQIGEFLTAIRRLRSYLEKGKERQVGIAFYCDNLRSLEELSAELERSVRGGRVDDYASPNLRDIRRELSLLEEKIRVKAENALRAAKNYAADSFVVKRNGRICIPIKKEYRSRVMGSLIDKSSTGMTLFIEPTTVTELREEYEWYLVEEETEVHRILYELVNQIAEHEADLREDIRVVVLLDVVFAKGKLSAGMKAVEPVITTGRHIRIRQARYPELNSDDCVPLDFTLGEQGRGMVITGPNTGGKTVAIKTVGLFSLMACSGLHLPCEEAEIAMQDQVLCDIGDGQNIADNLSTFSAHIGNVLEILRRVTPDSLVILDELGSGTDPAEGMGIAVAILEQLRLSGCLFLATTHYPEVKEYADRYQEITNARMGFDRESLRPLYRLEMGKAGESCALYIAKRLGLPEAMLRMAAHEAYGGRKNGLEERLLADLGLQQRAEGEKEKEHTEAMKPEKMKVPQLVRIRQQTEPFEERLFQRGDSVTVGSEQQIGIVVKPEDRNGMVLVQIKKEKQLISHKRLQLKVAAKELYPENYDFSIIFDTVENRKARHRLEKGHQEGLVVPAEE